VNATALVATLSKRVEELKPTLLTRDIEVHVTATTAPPRSTSRTT
jgi:hypothetical protein